MRSQTSPIPVRLHQRWFFPGELAACEYCGAAGHAVAPTCDGGRITPQLVDSPVGSGNVTASGPRTRRYGRNVFEPRRSQSGQCGEGSWGAVYAVDHGGVRCARGRAKERRSPLVPALHAQRPWFRQERDRTTVSAGSKVLVFTVDLATPGRRYSEVHDGMEKGPTILGMLGFVAQGATHPRWALDIVTKGWPLKFGTVARGNAEGRPVWEICSRQFRCIDDLERHRVGAVDLSRKNYSERYSRPRRCETRRTDQY